MPREVAAIAVNQLLVGVRILGGELDELQIRDACTDGQLRCLVLMSRCKAPSRLILDRALIRHTGRAAW